MKLVNRKSKLQRLLETAGDSLNVPSGVKSSLPDLNAGKGAEEGPDRRRRSGWSYGRERRHLVAPAP